MNYSIKLVTTYHYAMPVPFARHLLRLTPRDAPGQTVVSSTITIDPATHERSEAVDFFGNRVTYITVERPHRALAIASEALVHVDAPLPAEADATPSWTTIRDLAAATRDASPLSPVHCIFPSRLVAIDPAIRDYAAPSAPRGRPVLDVGIDLMARMKEDFTYDPAATEASTPTAEAFALRRGVCQDFAHIMIAGLRGLGLPAAYVSGYLRTEPLPGRPRLEGADATHAWVAIWCGEDAGWQGLDPTNNIQVAGSHIPLAFGRDYADVSPVDGIIVASGDHSVGISVDVIERPDVAAPAGAG